MGTSSFIHKLVLFLHIASAIIGFGSVFFLGVFGQAAGQRKGREGSALTEVANQVGEWFATPFIYATFVFGIALVLLSRGAVTFKMTWVWLSMLLFVVALGISHGLHRPNLRKIVALSVALSKEAAEMGPPPGSAKEGAHGIPGRGHTR